ncbi:MAG: N-acetylglucosamine kinase [Bryobacteraceae bacterium]
MKCILAIDGGGTRTQCLAYTHDCGSIGRSESGPSNHLLVDRETVRRSIDQATSAALFAAGVQRHETFVSAGLAGIDFDGRGAAEMQALLSSLGLPATLLNGDMVVAHAGALAGAPGVLALAGTGSVVLAVDQCGRRAKVGGWGPIYGDEGSALSVGQRALRAAAQAVDGRGPATSLVEGIVDAWHLSDFRDTIERVYLEHTEPREIAALAPIVAQAAELGDDVARSILRLCGQEIAKGVLAAIRGIEFERFPIAVSWNGSLLNCCEPVRRELAAALASALPATVLVAPRFSAVEGALLLGAKALGWEIPCTLRST